MMVMVLLVVLVLLEVREIFYEIDVDFDRDRFDEIDE